MSLEGRIEDLGVAELLYVVGVSRRSGLLRLEGRTGEFEILFREGSIVSARDNRRPATLHALLVRHGLSDDTHLAVLERQAARQGRPLAELLEAESVLPTGRLDELLDEEIRSTVHAALDLSGGTFDFELVQDEAEVATERFGGLLLADGVQPAKLPEVAERSRGGLAGGLSLPRSEGGRRAELLVDDSSISLPTLPPSEVRRKSVAAEEAGERRPLALLSLGGPALGRVLQPRLEAAGLRVVRPRTPAEVADRVLAAGEAGLPVCVVADVSPSATPGLELLARAQLAGRASRTLLVLDRRSTPAQLAAHRERADGLGVTHVVVPSGGEDEAAIVADELLDLLLAPDPRDESAEPEPVHGLSETAEAFPESLLGADREGPGLADAPAEKQDARLATLLRELHSVRDAPRLAGSLLEIALEYAPRAVLFVPAGLEVRAYGGGARSRADHEQLAARLPRLRLPAGDADLPCSGLRDGRSRRVPGALAGAALLAGLGGTRPEETAAIPLLSSGSAVAVLVVDDAGRGSLPDLGTLERFAAGLAPGFGDALEREARRAEARRQRAGS